MNEKDLANYLKNRKALVVDFTSSRSSIRRLLSQSGMKSSNVDIAENWKEAEEKIRTTSPEIVFAEYAMAERSGLELLPILREKVPNRLAVTFFVLADSNSTTVASAVAEEEADSLIFRPFSFGELQKTFNEVLDRKVAPSVMTKLIEDGRALGDAGKFDEAFEALTKAKAADVTAGAPYFEEAMLYRKVNDTVKARSSLEGGLKISPTHYKCLTGLLDMLIEQSEKDQAYAVACILTKNFPVPPKRIPDLVRLSVVNFKYEDILNYYEVFSKIENIQDQLVVYISAGLVVCGKYLLREGNRSGAAAALKRAQETCQYKPQILSTVLATYISAGMLAEAQLAYKHLPEELKKLPEFKVLDMLILNMNSPATLVVQLCENLLRTGINAAPVFEVLISRAFEVGRKTQWIEPFVLEAISLYPAKRLQFQALLEKYTALKAQATGTTGEAK